VDGLLTEWHAGLKFSLRLLQLKLVCFVVLGLKQMQGGAVQSILGVPCIRVTERSK